MDGWIAILLLFFWLPVRDIPLNHLIGNVANPCRPHIHTQNSNIIADNELRVIGIVLQMTSLAVSVHDSNVLYLYNGTRAIECNAVFSLSVMTTTDSKIVHQDYRRDEVGEYNGLLHYSSRVFSLALLRRIVICHVNFLIRSVPVLSVIRHHVQR